MASFKLGKMTLRSLFKKPITTSYPLEPVTFHPNVRGHVENDIELCILCGICQRCCPSGALEVNKKAGQWSIDRFACVQCKYCVNSCPKKSLRMENTYTKPSAHKRIETLTKPQPEKAPALQATDEVQMSLKEEQPVA